MPPNAMNARNLAIQEITKNIQLYSGKPRKAGIDPKTLRLNDPIDKPLVIMLSWLLAKQKHLSKFAELYIEQGYDVVTVAITPWQLLWPAKGTQVNAADLLKFLENNPMYNPLLLHGFSVGGYMWGECLVHMARDQERYSSILNRISGQIWDSAADITEIPVGVPKALFPTNQALQNALRHYMVYHMKTFHDAATMHYIRSSQMFHSTLVKSPALFLLSKTDPVGAVASNQRVRESWESLGISCSWKCWDQSPHVGHFHKHREEYVETLFNHLRSINMIGFADKLRAKL
ncbi:transmembrane protein 53 isoform X3 [Bradysia coprophila]|nr:transmembrane protein 53 isoform X3 [Bradysia coprophila]